LPLLVLQAKKSKPIRFENEWRLPPVLTWIVIQSLGLLLGLLGVVMSFRGPAKDFYAVLAMGLCFLLFALLAWPKTVYLGQSGVRQRSLFGGWKVISWNSISAVDERRDGTIVVRAAETKILHYPFHAGRAVLLEELIKHKHPSVKTDSMYGVWPKPKAKHDG